MSLSLTQTKTALGPGLTASFLGINGMEPYSYDVLPGGAGGTIDPTTGVYTAPAVPTDPALQFDTVRVTDYANVEATSQIMVGTPLLLFCEILQNQLNLQVGRVYLWDQKIMQFKDSGLYIAVSVASCKPFGNNNRAAATGWDTAVQSVNMLATLDIDIISRGPAARDRKEEVLMAVASPYSEFQQEANSFSIGLLPAGARFQDLSFVDGAAIPYRFRISLNMQYTVTKSIGVDYFDTFQDVEVATDP